MKTTSLIRDLAKDLSALSKTLTEIAKEQESAQGAESANADQGTELNLEKSQEKDSGADSSESKAKVTIEDVRAVLAEKSQDGLTAKVRELLDSFDAKKLSAVAEERLPELLEAARALK